MSQNLRLSVVLAPSIQEVPGCLLQLKQENEGESFESYEQFQIISISCPCEPKDMYRQYKRTKI